MSGGEISAGRGCRRERRGCSSWTPRSCFGPPESPTHDSAKAGVFGGPGWLAGHRKGASARRNLLSLAADDLRDALVAHAEHPRDVGHRQPVLVCLADRLVAVGPQPLGGSFQLGFPLGVVVGKCRQAGAGFGRLALGTGDRRIVGRIPANRLA